MRTLHHCVDVNSLSDVNEIETGNEQNEMFNQWVKRKAAFIGEEQVYLLMKDIFVGAVFEYHVIEKRD